MNRIRTLCTVIALCLLSAAALAAVPKQAGLEGEDAARFSRAVDLLDGYRGNSDMLQDAHAELTRLLRRHPRYAPAHREMARYFMMRGHINSETFEPGALEAAEYAIDQALVLDPGYAEAYVLFGYLYRVMGRHAEAVAALEKAERLGTDDPWLQNNWADLLLEEGRQAEAARRYQKVIDSGTPNRKAMVSAFEGLIRYNDGLGKLDEVDALYRRQIAYEPDSAWAYGNYARFLLCRKDDYEDSIRRSRQALGILNYGVGRYWLAAGLYRRWAQSVIAATPDAGRRDFEEALTLYPYPQEIAENAGHCAPLGQVGEALARNAAPRQRL